MLGGFGDGVPAVLVDRRRAEARERGDRGRVRRRGAVDHGDASCRPARSASAGYVACRRAPRAPRAASATVRGDRAGRVLRLGDAAARRRSRPAPTVGFSATTPATPAGAMICAVSVEVSRPTVSAARPAAVAAAEPADGAGRRLVGVRRQQHLAAERRVALRHVGVEQAAELGDVGLAEDDRARGLQLRDQRGVGAAASTSAARSSPPWSAARARRSRRRAAPGCRAAARATPRGRALAVEQLRPPRSRAC